MKTLVVLTSLFILASCEQRPIDLREFEILSLDIIYVDQLTREGIPPGGQHGFTFVAKIKNEKGDIKEIDTVDFNSVEFTPSAGLSYEGSNSFMLRSDVVLKAAIDNLKYWDYGFDFSYRVKNNPFPTQKIHIPINYTNIPEVRLGLQYHGPDVEVYSMRAKDNQGVARRILKIMHTQSSLPTYMILPLETKVTFKSQGSPGGSGDDRGLCEHGDDGNDGGDGGNMILFREVSDPSLNITLISEGGKGGEGGDGGAAPNNESCSRGYDGDDGNDGQAGVVINQVISRQELQRQFSEADIQGIVF